MAVIALLLVFVVCTVGGAFYLIDFSLLPDQKDDRAMVSMRDDSIYSFLRPWRDSLEHVQAIHDTTIVNRDGLRLHGYYIRCAESKGKTAILVHGYTDCAFTMMPIAYIYYHDMGYNVLLPDLQYHGESEGKAVNMGWKDRLDVLQWSEVADSVFGGHTQMVVHGISMGAATTMMLSGEKLPSYFKCFVEDCGYTSVWDEFAYELREMFSLPVFPMLYEASVISKIRFGWSFGEASALKQVKKCHLPMLFIHGDADNYVPTRMVYPLYQAKPQPKELWVVKGASHSSSFRLNQNAYREKISRFVGTYIR